MAANGSGSGTAGAGAGSAGASGQGQPGGKNAGGAGGSDAALERALGTFDGTILSERGAIEERANQAPSGETSGAGGSGNDVAKASGSSGGQDAGSGNGASPGGLPEQRVPAPPMPSATATAATDLPKDIPDGRDDDVVARQLREAAMAETDPVLKEKLWEEYRRYKSGS